MIGSPDVTIARPGWFDQAVIPVTPPSASWRTDGPGSFECQIENRTLLRYGLNMTGVTSPLKGRWLWWEHPTAGAWGGVITRSEVGQWMTSVTAEQFHVLLRKRRLSANYGPMALSPGSLALMFLTSAERAGESFMLTGWTAEEGGETIDLEPRGGDLCDDVLPELASFGYQWRVTSDTMDERAFEFRRRLGSDKSRTVLISEGRTIPLGGLRTTGDLWTVANSIVGIGGGDAWKQAAGYQLDDESSMRALGRRYETTIAYSGVATRSTIVPRVKQDLARLAYPNEIAEIQVVDDDYAWRDFREGDTITVAAASVNLHAPFEVDIRSVDMTSGLMTIAGRLTTSEAS